ncbi:MAG TPA: MerR family transcriptional regulator [Burkholderiaceae bacterium]|nr:MerR family transcriptional regulator [Burkholderiaceae bacterium]
MEKTVVAIPPKRYFTIGEVSELCGVKPYVLRYWEQEFTQLRPMKRRGNRRYYQHHEVLLIRRIRDLLYEEGFTISGARNRLAEPSAPVAAGAPLEMGAEVEADVPDEGTAADAQVPSALLAAEAVAQVLTRGPATPPVRLSMMERKAVLLPLSMAAMKQELLSISALLGG